MVYCIDGRQTQELKEASVWFRKGSQSRCKMAWGFGGALPNYWEKTHSHTGFSIYSAGAVPFFFFRAPKKING